jgi:proteasome lid subunit RPN8/RPN11
MWAIVLTQLWLPRPHYQTMLTQLQNEYPLEGCGLLAGDCTAEGVGRVSQVYPVANAWASPTAYWMEPAALLSALLDIEAQDLSLLAIYHSHPQSAAAPSARDIAQAYYPEAAQVIVSLQEWTRPQARAFLIHEGQADEISLHIL